MSPKIYFNILHILSGHCQCRSLSNGYPSLVLQSLGLTGQFFCLSYEKLQVTDLKSQYLNIVQRINLIRKFKLAGVTHMLQLKSPPQLFKLNMIVLALGIKYAEKCLEFQREI